MKFPALLFAFVLLTIAPARAAQAYRQVQKVEPLPIELDRDFQFRKVKQFLLADIVPTKKGSGKLSNTGLIRDPSIGFERTYHLFGAVTGLDQSQRYGDYLDFFWRARRPGEVTVRFEYRQEKLRTFVQAREVTYPHGKGSHTTSFDVVGDDFFTDGRILSWRCSLVSNGRIVAQKQSYLWR